MFSPYLRLPQFSTPYYFISYHIQAASQHPPPHCLALRLLSESVIVGLEHRAQNEVWRDRKSMKMLAWRDRKSMQMVVWQGLGESWGTSWDLWCDFPEISAEVGGKMGARWAKLAARCAQDGL